MGLASNAQLFGLYKIVAKFATIDGIVVYHIICPKYLELKNGGVKSFSFVNKFDKAYSNLS